MKQPIMLQNAQKCAYEKIDQVRQKRGLSWSEVIKRLNNMVGLNAKGEPIFGRNTANDWKNGKSGTFLDYIKQLEEILETSLGQIVFVENCGNNIINSINESPFSTLTITENNLSKQESELVEIYRNLSLKDQLDLVMYALKLKGEE